MSDVCDIRPDPAYISLSSITTIIFNDQLNIKCYLSEYSGFKQITESIYD